MLFCPAADRQGDGHGQGRAGLLCMVKAALYAASGAVPAFFLRCGSVGLQPQTNRRVVCYGVLRVGRFVFYKAMSAAQNRQHPAFGQTAADSVAL